MTQRVTDLTTATQEFRPQCPKTNITNAARNGKALNDLVAEWMDGKPNNYPLFTWAWLTRNRIDRITASENMRPYPAGSKLTEIPVWARKGDKTIIKGKIDAILEVNGQPAIIETKGIATVPRNDGQEAMQASIYQYLWNQMHPDKQIKQAFLLWVPMKDAPRLIPIKKQPKELLEKIVKGEANEYQQ